MGNFSGIENATTGPVYFTPGRYEIEVKVVKMFQSFSNGLMFIIEAKILKSDNPDRKVGQTASHSISLKHKQALGDVANFVAAGVGIDSSDQAAMRQVTEEVVELCVGPTQPLAGKRLALVCTSKQTKAGSAFTIHRYSPL